MYVEVPVPRRCSNVKLSSLSRPQAEEERWMRLVVAGTAPGTTNVGRAVLDCGHDKIVVLSEKHY
jgi:hypothetical protein